MRGAGIVEVSTVHGVNGAEMVRAGDEERGEGILWDRQRKRKDLRRAEWYLL